MAKLRSLNTRPRSIYKQNPLVEVIAAVRYPAILAIEQQLPIDLQEQLKSEYPILQMKKRAVLPQLFGDADPSLQSASQGWQTVYEFASEDKSIHASLSAETVALTTTSYTRWEDFRTRFVSVLQLFHSIYAPTLYTRVGLRYKDLIDRNKLDLADTPWSELIHQDLLRPFTFFSDDLEDNPNLSATVGLEIRNAAMRISYGFVRDPEQNLGFLMDTDCYVDPAKIRETAGIDSAIEGLHKHTSLAFGACISDRLHDALSPTEPN